MPDQPSLPEFVLRRALSVDGYGATVAGEMLSLLDDASAELTDRISSMKGTSFTRTHYRRASVEINGVLRSLSDSYSSVLDSNRKEVIETEFDQTMRALKRDAGGYVRQSTYVIPEAQIVSIINNPVGGRFIDEWIKEHMGRNASRLSAALTQSIVMQDTMRQASAKIKDAFDVSRKGADWLARTSMMQSANLARDMAFSENQSVIEHYVAMGTLDSRTCLQCAVWDGEIREKREELPEFPLHGGCRCTVAPITDMEEWEKMTRPSIVKEDRHVVQHRDGTTSSKWKNKQVRQRKASVSFRDFFEKQPEGWKREYLGRSRYEAYKSGAKLDDLVKRRMRL